ncbi:MAG TPA: glycosyltransferase, partial [Bacilli bacterium]
CFVSLHRAEGFGLVIAEAMYFGKPVIATGWSGNMDFMNHMNSAIVNYNLTQIGHDVGPYKAPQIWAEPDIHHAAELMRQMVGDPDWRNAIAQAGRQTINQHYSPEAVGNRMRQRLQKNGLI